MNKEKAEGLIIDHFVWKEEGRKVEAVEGEVENEGLEEEVLKKMVTKY